MIVQVILLFLWTLANMFFTYPINSADFQTFALICKKNRINLLCHRINLFVSSKNCHFSNVERYFTKGKFVRLHNIFMLNFWSSSETKKSRIKSRQSLCHGPNEFFLMIFINYFFSIFCRKNQFVQTIVKCHSHGTLV